MQNQSSLKTGIYVFVVTLVGAFLMFGCILGHFFLRKHFADQLSPASYTEVTGKVKTNIGEYYKDTHKNHILSTRYFKLDKWDKPFRNLPLDQSQEEIYNQISEIKVDDVVTFKVLKADLYKKGMYFNWLTGWLFFREDVVRVMTITHKGKEVLQKDPQYFYTFEQAINPMFFILGFIAILILWIRIKFISRK